MDRDTYWVWHRATAVAFACVAAGAAGVCVTVTRTTRLIDYSINTLELTVIKHMLSLSLSL